MLLTIDPFPGHADLTDGFGSMEPPRRYPHTGLDWNGGLAGEAIPAWAAGTIVRNEWSSGNGWTLAIRIDGLVDGVQLYYSCIHMASRSELPVGTYVALGDLLGQVGDTGTNARGPHLHSSLSDSPDVHLGYGRLRDPWDLIQAHLTDLATSLLTNTKEEDVQYPYPRISKVRLTLDGGTTPADNLLWDNGPGAGIVPIRSDEEARLLIRYHASLYGGTDGQGEDMMLNATQIDVISWYLRGGKAA